MRAAREGVAALPDAQWRYSPRRGPDYVCASQITVHWAVARLRRAGDSGGLRGDRLDLCELFAHLPLCRLNVVIGLKVQSVFG